MTVAVDIRKKRRPEDMGGFSLVIGDKVRANGNAAGVVDPWLEVGIVHGRSLLEFLGLGERNGKLVGRGEGRPNDWRLPDFDLPSMTAAEALRAYGGEPEEAEESLVSIMVFANRAVAHITNPVDPERFGSHHLQIASRGIYALVVRHLYRPLNLKEPEFGFPSE